MLIIVTLILPDKGTGAAMVQPGISFQGLG